jgi:hypothetical protein
LATLVKTDFGKWKAVIRKTGWPTTSRTFRTKRDAEDWARRTEDDMVRGAYIQRAPADRLTVAKALERYLAEVTPTKRPSTQISDHGRANSDPEYLTRLVGDFRRIEAKLPNPVPAGLDPRRYFSDNYDKLGVDPVAYGWFQLYMVISAYDEPARSFQQIMDALPSFRYTDK